MIHQSYSPERAWMNKIQRFKVIEYLYMSMAGKVDGINQCKLIKPERHRLLYFRIRLILFLGCDRQLFSRRFKTSRSVFNVVRQAGLTRVRWAYSMWPVPRVTMELD